jgi:iron complex outermembrane receptor protein
MNVNGTVGRGTVGVDFNAIPLSAIDRVEILRDGAAAQYGSDAIAGVINVILKERTNAFSLNSSTQPTLAGDGLEKMIGANYGVEIGKGGMLNVSGELRSRDAINRAGNYSGNVYSANDSIDQIRIEENDFFGQLSDYNDHQVMQIGGAKMQDGAAFFNLIIPGANNAELYANGGVNIRHGESRGFYRFPMSTLNVVSELYPNGFSPEIHSEIIDKTLTVGLRGEQHGWNIDFSNSFGSNSIDLTVKNSNNASMGIASPTNAYAGGFLYSQNTTQINLSRNIDKIFFLENTHFSVGSEYRVEQYSIISGETDAWIDGGEVNSNGESYVSGMQVFPGFQPQNALEKGRTNFASYIDVEFHPTDKLLFNTAARFENYDFFGSNLTSKLASRYKMTDNFSFRGSYSSGFRAPSLHQIYFNNLSTQFIGGQSFQVGTFNNESPIAKALGIGTLQPENSNNFSFGFSAKNKEGFTLSGDAYYIAIKNRIVLSGGISDGFEDILEPVGAGSAQLFTNAINTETRGFDLVATHSKKIGYGLLRVTGAYNQSFTKVVGGITTTSILEGAEDDLFNREEISRLQVAQPRNKTILTLTYSMRKWNFQLKNSRFGTVEYIHPLDGDVNNWVLNEYTQEVESRDQVFSAKILTDVLVSYRFSNYFTMAIGGNNILNIYPDKHTHYANTIDGNFIYSRKVQQFGVMGASYFVRLNFSF